MGRVARLPASARGIRPNHREGPARLARLRVRPRHCAHIGGERPAPAPRAGRTVGPDDADTRGATRRGGQLTKESHVAYETLLFEVSGFRVCTNDAGVMFQTVGTLTSVSTRSRSM